MIQSDAFTQEASTMHSFKPAFLQSKPGKEEAPWGALPRPPHHGWVMTVANATSRLGQAMRISPTLH